MVVASFVISVVAAAFAAVAFLRTSNVDERELFLKVHGRLLEPELVTARREVLYERVKQADDVDGLTGEEKSQLFRLFATYDLLGLYVEQGWIPLRLVLLEWAETLEKSKAQGAAMIEWRKRKVQNAWPHYEWLVDQVETRSPWKPRNRPLLHWGTRRR